MSGKRILLVSHAGVNVALLRRALIKRLVAEGFEVHVAVPRDRYFEDVSALGASPHHWEVAGGSLNPIAAIKAVEALEGIVKDVAPALVHSFTHQPNIFSRLAVPHGVPLVNSVTGLGSNFLGTGAKGALKRFIFHTLYKCTASRNDTIIFQNDDDRAHFETRSLTGTTPVSMVRGTGVDTVAIRPDAFDASQRETARKALGLSLDHVVLTLAARLIRDKGVFEFLEAARILAPRHPKARFLLVGEPFPGNPTSLSPEAIDAAKADGTAVFAGWRDDMPLVWGMSDVAVLPSYREGLPVGLQEALASGLPVVTTDAPGCREIVEPGKNGLLVPVGDARALADAMGRLLDDADARTAMGRSSRERAEQLFDANTLAGEIIQVYRNTAKELT